ncbi:MULTISPECIES: glycosyltransferase [unclassified Luteococcus]|uniref:glycosyltransferase n=1 Tax=unclassified Luteococcus TaxID=2639923 RepID=UPI00313C13CD
MSTAHVFLTRFNLPSEGVESLIRAKEGWLRERIELFERYTVPSVRAQLGDDISWVVYLDTESPQWLLDKMYAWRDEGLLTPVLATSVGPVELTRDIQAAAGRQNGPVITSNLDNDDGLAIDFVQRLRQAPVTQERTALYLAHGLITNGRRCFLREDRTNAFCAVREDLSDLMTCWSDWHNRLGRHMDVVEVEGEPGWLQVIHGANVSNRVRGTMTDPARYRALFPGMLDGVQAPTATELARDRLVEAPTRWLRDSARGNARAALVKVLGKERFDAVKYHGGKAARGAVTKAKDLRARKG